MSISPHFYDGTAQHDLFICRNTPVIFTCGRAQPFPYRLVYSSGSPSPSWTKCNQDHSKPIRGGKGGIPPLEARRATLPLEGKCTPPPKIGPTPPKNFAWNESGQLVQAKNFYCLRQALILLWTEREAESSLSKPEGTKNFCLQQALILL